MTVPLISALPTVPSYDNTNFESLAPAFLSFLKNTFQAEMNAAIAAINNYDYGAAVNISKVVGLTAGRIPYGAGSGALGNSDNLFWDSANSRLGVGTTSPTRKLHVTDTANPQLRLEGAGGSVIDFEALENELKTQGNAKSDVFSGIISLSHRRYERHGFLSSGVGNFENNVDRSILRFSVSSSSSLGVQFSMLAGEIELAGCHATGANMGGVYYKIPFTIFKHGSYTMVGVIGTAITTINANSSAPLDTPSVSFTGATATAIDLQVKFKTTGVHANDAYSRLSWVMRASLHANNNIPITISNL